MEQTQPTTPKAGPRDVFLHLLAMSALYTSAVNFVTLIFKYIEIYFPDKLEYGYYNQTYDFSSIRWSIASLVIVFPVYILTSWYLNKLYAADPAKRNFRIRKWLVYLTLFIAALIIIGDLIFLVNSLLGGELTARFILKVLTVFFVAGSIFYYYLADIRRYRTE